MNDSLRSGRKGRFSLYLILLSLLICIPALSSSSAAGTGSAPPQLERQVREWMAALSAREPFTSWKEAVPEIHALGPGTHGWLATLTVHGEPAGYMVIHAAQDGTYRLGEYGTGPQLLYDSAVLRKTLLLNGLISTEDESFKAETLYFHPFAAVWRITAASGIYLADAKTGELLPFDEESWERQVPMLAASGRELLSLPSGGMEPEASLLKDTFDPYDRLPWLTGEEPQASNKGKEMQHRIARGVHLRYVTEPYGGEALYALPVTGFIHWSNGRLDLALDMEGSRFIPLSLLAQYGRFYE